MALLLAGVALVLGSAAWRYWLDPEMARPPVPWLTALAWSGSMVFRLFVQVAQLETERRKRTGWPVLLAVPAVVSDILVHFVRVGTGGGWGLLVSAAHVLVALGVMACCVAASVHVLRFFTLRTMTAPAWLILGISIVGIVSLLSGLAGLFIGKARLFAVMDGFLAVTVLLGAVLSFRWPDLIDRLHRQTVRQRYARSTLAGLDVEGLIAGMTAMMRRSAIYRRPDCDLDQLSGRMGMTRHQVSELLNDRMGVSFNHFVNGFRIEAAKDLLLSRPELTVLAIAGEVGFGNKTSFNEAFRRQLGVTPSQYRANAGADASG
jgi:AraC-like DNA-binding protein